MNERTEPFLMKTKDLILWLEIVMSAVEGEYLEREEALNFITNKLKERANATKFVR